MINYAEVQLDKFEHAKLKNLEFECLQFWGLCEKDYNKEKQNY